MYTWIYTFHHDDDDDRIKPPLFFFFFQKKNPYSSSLKSTIPTSYPTYLYYPSFPLLPIILSMSVLSVSLCSSPSLNLYLPKVYLDKPTSCPNIFSLSLLLVHTYCSHIHTSCPQWGPLTPLSIIIPIIR